MRTFRRIARCPHSREDRISSILIVDDLSSNRRSLATLLRQNGHQPTEAPDGQSALAAVRASHPDLIITDVLMPVMDGYEFVSKLRLDPATRELPVIFYTPRFGETEAIELAASLGVCDVLTRPAPADDVLRAVVRALAAPLPSADTAGPRARASGSDREQLRLLTSTLSEASGDLRAANARLRALVNIGLELASEPDPERLLSSVCEAACDLFSATYVTLGIVELENRTVQRVTSCGTVADVWIKPGDPIPAILTDVVAARQTLRGHDPRSDPDGRQFPPQHPEVQSFLAAPVASPGQVYGWFCLVGNEGHDFTNDDQDLVTALAGQVGRIYESHHFRALSAWRTAELEREVLGHAQADSALRVAEERMRFALESASVGIWDMNYVTGHHVWSSVLEAQYGLAPATFRGTFEAFLEGIHPEDRDAVLATISHAMHSGDDFTEQHRTIWTDGTVHWLRGAGRVQLGVHGEPVRAIGISQDITEHHQLEGQYRQAQKMEAVGQLAGGVAHDFNNLLTAILVNCEMLEAELAPADSRGGFVGDIHKAALSAAGLTRQLLAFSRKQVIEPAWHDLDVVVAEMRVMLGRLIREDVTIAVERSAGAAPVMADRSQLEQIVMNLALNARDAMPSGGTLTIRTSTEGPRSRLSISDTGTGMVPEVLARVFEPFFTTKEVGRGTGLGLATVQSIVTGYGGSVQVHSEPGRGTSVDVYLPMAGERPEAAIVAPVARPARGNETVLVVEDDDLIRQLTRRILERQGYVVLTAAGAEAAIRLFDTDVHVDVMLTDVVMPGLSGPELSGQLRERHPGLRVVYMSGYAEGTIAEHGKLRPGIMFLQKPFTSDSLCHKISDALQRGSDSRPPAPGPTH